MAYKKPIRWLSEEEAAKLIGYKPYTLRRYAKSGKLQIIYTHVNLRRFKYNLFDIERLLLQNSNA